MTLASLLSLGGGLALVLGLLLLLVRVVKGLRPDLLNARRGETLQVVSRISLAPRQGVAVVRFRDRDLLLSYGEGGVRLLRDQDQPRDRNWDEGADEDGGEVGVRVYRAPRVPSAPVLNPGQGFPTIWHRIRKAAGLAGASFLLLGLPGTQTGASAQGSPTETNPVAASVQEALSQVEPGDISLSSFAQGVSGELIQAAPGPQGQAPESGTGNTGAQAVPGAKEAGALSPERAVYGLMSQLPDMSLQVGQGQEGLQLQGPVGTVLFIGFLTLLPTLLLMMTGFTRILVVLHLLKQALGTQTAPPTHLLTAMALLLTGFVMAPTLSEVNRTALTPWMEGEMDELQMIKTASVPMRGFMLRATREEDLAAFLEMHGSAPPATAGELPLVVVTSAFVTSELRHAFQMGFALFLPFVVIDIVVASVLMSMGMFMLPPVMVSLPFKLLLFVLVDGWTLVVGGLVRSFA